MSSRETSALIDYVAAVIAPHVGHNPDAADAVATEIIGELQSRYLLIPLPRAEADNATRAELGFLVPELLTTKGHA